jgi:NTP pyrophosphatase (non-canonical NTP hydrolase)
MSSSNNIKEYSEIVQSVTSAPSESIDAMIERLQDLKAKSMETNEINVSLFMTGAVGLSCEANEILEIMKKIVFQGKPLHDEKVLFHLKREMGDLLWYYVNLLRSLGMTLEEVMEENVTKLNARYPEKKFSVFRSENRQENDL